MLETVQWVMGAGGELTTDQNERDFKILTQLHEFFFYIDRRHIIRFKITLKSAISTIVNGRCCLGTYSQYSLIISCLIIMTIKHISIIKRKIFRRENFSQPLEVNPAY